MFRHNYFMKLCPLIAAVLFASLDGSLFRVPAAEAGALQLVPPDWQLGVLTNGQNVAVTFGLTNRSDQAVKITDVDTSCRCTSVLKSPAEIPPHGHGMVELNFNSSRSDGVVTQMVVVETADGQNITGQICAFVTPAPGAKTVAPWIPDRGDGTYQNPVLFADYSDPDAVRVGDDFYLVSSSFHVAPGLPILHSKDLVNWTIINHVFAVQPPADHFSVVRHGEGVWAPAIRFHAGRFWIFYPDPDYGIYFTTATNPAGEWTPPQLVQAGKGIIDPCPFWDDDGQPYLVHGWAKSRAGIANRLTLHKLSADGTRVLDAGKVIIDGNTIPNWTTLEGPKLYKRHGYYYVFAPSGGVTGGYQAVFRATNIYGPYEHRVVLDQGRTAINGPHQGAWVDTPAGENWFLHFQDRGAYGRVVHLEPMIWRDDGWPVIGSDPDHTGKGEPVAVWAKPKVGRSDPPATPQTSDEFGGEELGLQWQWNANPQDGWASFSARPGFLRLASVPAPPTRGDGLPANNSLYDAPNFLLLKFPAPEFTVATALQFSPAAAGEFAGLTVFGFDYARLGLLKTAAGLRLVYVVNPGANRGAKEREVAGVDATNSAVYLRVTVSRGARCQFAYSFDDQTFTAIGEPFKASGDRWIGAKVGVIASAPATATRTGHADFDWFRVTPATP
jgi:beta-xylosidase